MKIYKRTINEDGVSELAQIDRFYTHDENGKPLVTILYFPGDEIDNRLSFFERMNDVSGTIKYAEHLLGGREIHKNPHLQFLGISYDSWHNLSYDFRKFTKNPENYTYNESYAMSKFLAPLYTQIDDQGNIIDRLPTKTAMDNMGRLVICGNSLGGFFGMETDNAMALRMTGLGYGESEIDKILQRKQSLFLGNTAESRFSRSTNIFVIGKNDKVAEELVPDFNSLVLDGTDDLSIKKVGKNSLLAAVNIPYRTELEEDGQYSKIQVFDSEHHHPALSVHGNSIVNYMAKNIMTNMVRNALSGKIPGKSTDLMKNTPSIVNPAKPTTNHVYTEEIKIALAKSQNHEI